MQSGKSIGKNKGAFSNIVSGERDVKFKFTHGLGDCVHAALLSSLYVKAGYRVTVECNHDKGALFEAAGCHFGPANASHKWQHYHSGEAVSFSNPWVGNKVAWNIIDCPCPPLGVRDAVWPDLLDATLDIEQVIGKDVRQKVGRYLESLGRPFVLVHAHANTSSDSKDLSAEQEQELFAELLKRFPDWCVLIGDWDSRGYRPGHPRVRHLTTEFDYLTIKELYLFLRSARLFVGVDSGPLHLARVADCPTVGVWHKHSPTRFSLPRDTAVNLVCGQTPDPEWLRYRRDLWNVVEVREHRPTGRQIADCAESLLADHWGLGTKGAVLRGMLDLTETHDHKKHYYRDRHATFGFALDWLSKIPDPVVVETGTTRQADDWTAGMSTVLFGFALHHWRKGSLTSVDIDPRNCQTARHLTEPYSDRVTVVESDSVKWLTEYSGQPIDLLYLDSLDADAEHKGYAEHCLSEVRAALPHLSESAVILIDDCPFREGRHRGKGELAIPFLLENGWRVERENYQVALCREGK